MTEFAKTSRNQVHRVPKRASYDRETIYNIVDEALICHVGFVDQGQPFVIPTLHARIDNDLILHGATASRLLKCIQDGQPMCVSMTLLDGLVLARSVFNHSMNYRSVVLFGTGRLLEDDAEKLQALAALTEHVVKGRWADARQPNRKELHATAVVAMSIDSASAKVRSGPPLDDEEDYALPIWAGVLPIQPQVLTPVSDPRLPETVELPEYLIAYDRTTKSGHA